MCILFVYCGEDGGDSDYSLILSTNRDEHYGRPAANAAFWEDDLTVIGGRDLEKGREGGTWLALSTAKSRLGALLNLTGNPKTDAKGRGSLVTNYVRSDLSTEEYIESLWPERELYNDFNLVTVEIGREISRVYCYNNSDNNLVKGLEPYQAYCNSLVGTPYLKAIAGREKFQAICREWGKIATQDILLEKLLDLMRWQYKHLPDEELQRRCPKWYDQLGSVFVHMPVDNYGTRAQTFVLVKKNGEIEFIEHSLQQPIDPNDLKWNKTHIKSQLQ